MQAPATPPTEQGLVDIGFEHGDAQLTAGRHEPSFLEQFLQYPEDSSVSLWRGGDVANPLFSGSFSSTNSFGSTGSFGGTSTNFGSNSSFSSNVNNSTLGSGPELSTVISNRLPTKVEPSPTMPTPTLLSQVVDTSQYENVENDAWMFSSVDYDAPSPASLGSMSNDPCTPVSPHGGDAFLRYPIGCNYLTSGRTMDGTCKYTGDGILTQVNTPVLDLPAASSRTSCECPGCTGSFPDQRPHATIWQATRPLALTQQSVSHHSHAHGLPFVTPTNLDGSVVPGAPPSLAIDPASMGTHPLPSMDRYTLEMSPEQDSESERESNPDVSDHAITEAAHRRSRDRYLLKMREKGWSYKEIKHRGNFSEAESTLRGRVRVLTKDKSQRVRKPEWTEKDLGLLDKAVRRFSGLDGSGRDRNGRMPWKKVSEWMSKKGSTYVFAPATCAKKFKELN
ncbi:hypothetical protein DOTSEDRAFT_20009 [Dothistroma septosporum NZE10]|uniref:Myb-like domain-containing protein n=1 Tax=Dothistroma septosporum (strain NZE10 / CBS 128990) TaxID=675120 RepID=N1Q1K4_DOTSN|nr:hypothetical protein DOTSEDRAFT_20009 [Dothistroma septosporum NZE10]